MSTSDAHLQQQSVVTREFAACDAVLAIPTTVAGIDGMNFENRPEPKLRCGYDVVLNTTAPVFGWP